MRNRKEAKRELMKDRPDWETETDGYNEKLRVEVWNRKRAIRESCQRRLRWLKPMAWEESYKKTEKI